MLSGVGGGAIVVAIETEASVRVAFVIIAAVFFVFATVQLGLTVRRYSRAVRT